MNMKLEEAMQMTLKDTNKQTKESYDSTSSKHRSKNIRYKIR